MVKKAGIVVAVATAGVLALSPLAFATSPDEHRARGDVDHAHVERDNQNVECDFANDQAVTGVGGLLGISLGIPINVAIPIASCNNTNVEDIVDVATTNPDTTVAATS